MDGSFGSDIPAFSGTPQYCPHTRAQETKLQIPIRLQAHSITKKFAILREAPHQKVF
jgi:hypothetical protein